MPSVEIFGKIQEKDVLTASFIDEGRTLLSFQWLRDGKDIDGATTVTYTLAQVDVGKKITVKASFTDDNGIIRDTVTSAEPSSNVLNVNDATMGAVKVTGAYVENGVLSANASALADLDGIGTFTYQWLCDGKDISCETARTFSLTQDDIGQKISVKVSYTDGQGTDESVTSVAPTHGIASTMAATANVSSLDGSNGFRLDGANYKQSGFSVSVAGDFNGDGFDDIIIGAPHADPSGNSSSDSSYVVFGGVHMAQVPMPRQLVMTQ